MTTARKKPAALVPSAVSAWGDEPAQREHELPTGRVMTLRRGPSLSRLVRLGVIPSTIIGVDLIEPEEGGERVMEINSKKFEEQRAAVVCAMTVDPPVVLEPLDGALLYDLLEEREIVYIMAWAAQGVAGIAGFPQDVSGADDGADSDEARSEAE